MTEKLQNHEINVISNVETGFTKLADDAPSFEDHIKQYQEKYPDAVEDIDKARAMAKAGNRVRNEAALRNDLESAIQNGDSEKENGIMNQLADMGVEDVMDSLKYYPDGTAFQRAQKAFLTAFNRTRIGRKINYISELHNIKEEARKWNQSEWAQSLLADVDAIEETAGDDHDYEITQQTAEREEWKKNFEQGQREDIAWLRKEADLRRQLGEAIQNGDTKQERKLTNQLASNKVDDLMDSLKNYPDNTAFQRVQKSILGALYKTRLGKQLNHMSMVHETRQEIRLEDQSEWAQSLLAQANDIENNLQKHPENML